MLNKEYIKKINDLIDKKRSMQKLSFNRPGIKKLKIIFYKIFSLSRNNCCQVHLELKTQDNEITEIFNLLQKSDSILDGVLKYINLTYNTFLKVCYYKIRNRTSFKYKINNNNKKLIKSLCMLFKEKEINKINNKYLVTYDPNNNQTGGTCYISAVTPKKKNFQLINFTTDNSFSKIQVYVKHHINNKDIDKILKEIILMFI